MPIIRIKNKGLPKAQFGPPVTEDDDSWIRKIMEYEVDKGGYDKSKGAYGLTNWGYNSRNPSSIDEAIGFYKQDFLPRVQQYPMGMRERAGDFLYNTGRDPRIYMLDQYLQTVGNKKGLANRTSYNIDMNADPAAWNKIKPQFEAEWNKYSKDINKLPLDQQVQLLDKGRDFYYSHTAPKGSNWDLKTQGPYPAYEATWKPRLNIFGSYQAPSSATAPAATVPTISGPASTTKTTSPTTAPVSTTSTVLKTTTKPVATSPAATSTAPAATAPAATTSTAVSTGSSAPAATTNKPTTGTSAAGPFGLDMTKLSNFVQELDANAPREDAKAGRLADQPFYNPFDVKWGQRQDPQVDVTGSESNKPFDQYATSVNNSTTSSRGALNLPQLVNTNLLSQEQKPVKNKNNRFSPNMLSGLGRFSGVGLNMLSAGMDYIDDRNRQKEWDNWFRQQNLPDNMYAATSAIDRGDFDINEGIYRPNQLTPPNIGAAVAEYGGTQSSENMNLIKIRLRPTGQEMMKYGGQSGLGMGLDIGQRRVYTHMPKGKADEVSNTLNPIPRDQANIEAEKGETAYGDLDGDGALEHFNIGGKRHVNGGTPLNVPEGSFIFSDTKKMIIKDPSILEKFGMTPRKEGYTPAEIAKKYDINKYKAIMEDPNTDQIRKNTAQIMIKSFQKKLAELAIIQESMKGFPNGIPEIAKQTNPELAEQYAKEYGLEEEALEDEANQQEQVMEQGMTEPEEEMMGEEQGQMSEEDMMQQPMPEEGMMEEPMPEAEYGGSRLPRYQGAKGSSTVKRFPVWSPEYQDVISGYIKDKYDVKVPINARDQANTERFTLPSMQSSRGNRRVYGEEDWTDAEHMADFAERQAEFLKENPNWDPTKKGSTRQFQEWYNKKATELGLPQYFGKGQRFQSLDDMFGEYTYSAPSLSPKKAPQPVEEKKVPPPPPPYYGAGKISTTGRPIKTPYGWMTPDVFNLATASAVAPRKRLPYIAPVKYEPGRVSLEDWRALAGARQSMYNKQGELLGVYGPTAGQGAAQSVAAGQMAEGLAGDIANVTSRNVDRVNQFLQQERQRKDQFNLLGADRATELYKGNVVANQQYDNARRQYLNNIAKTFGQGWGNASKLGMLNAVNPYYQVDPFSGRSYFTNRAKGWDRFSRSAGQSMASNFPTLKNYYMSLGMKEDNAEKQAIEALKGANKTGSALSPSDFLNSYGNITSNVIG